MTGSSEALYTLVLLCHYAGRIDYWVPFHQAMARLAEQAPTDLLLLAETFADPLTVSPWALAELDDVIDQLRRHDGGRPHHPHRDRRLLRRPAAGLP